MKPIKAFTVTEYFSLVPPKSRKLMKDMRKIIKDSAPGAEEVISYGMPAFRWNGMLVWYAAFKEHIGFFPKTTPIVKFKEELSKYKTSKGTIQFPLDKPIPVALVKKIVKYRMKENLAMSK